MPIAPAIVEYYLALLPGRHPEPRPGPAARSSRSTTPRPDRSAQKLLERPRLLRQIARARSRTRARPTSSPTTRPSSSATSRSRSASRCTAPTRGCAARAPRPAAAGCSPRRASATRSGVEDLHTLDDVVDAAVRDAARSGRRSPQVIVKLNEGVSGEGNALVDLRGLPAAGDAARAREAVAARLVRCSSSARTTPFEVVPGQARRTRRHRRGAHRRRRAAQPERAAAGHSRRRRSSCCRRTTSCSAGRAGRATWAAVPRRPRLRARDQRSTPRSIGERLAREGRARAASPSTSSSSATPTDAWTSYAIELNLRKGGTTHPFLTLQFLTDGRYDAASRRCS